MSLTVEACAATHQGDRREQQDRVAIMAHPRYKGMAVAVVADGMGGHTGGALAAEQVLHTAKSSLDAFFPAEESARGMLESSMREAHTLIKASRFMNEKEPHSTAVMLLMQPNAFTWGHCGDSRLYRFRGAELLERTVDHSFVEHLLAIGKIKPEQLATHPSRNVLMTSLGGQDDPRFDFSQASDLQPGDSFLLCSDGLWAYFEPAEIGQLLTEYGAREACEQMIALARQRADGGGDNLSLVVVRLLEMEKPKAKAKPVFAFQVP